jgi:predicted nucleic acid-binding protein
VPLVYFDSSALVKLVLEESGTPLAAALWDGCDGALSSRLAYPEVRAALAALARNHDLNADELLDAERAWEEFWGATRKVELTPDVEQSAGRLARSHALRGADAVHLASALAIADDDLVVAVWDRRLHGGVRASGIRVAPASLDAEVTVPVWSAPARPDADTQQAAPPAGVPPAEPTG